MNLKEMLMDQVGATVYSDVNKTRPFVVNTVDNAETHYNSYAYTARQLQMLLELSKPLSVGVSRTSLQKAGFGAIEELEELVSEVKLKLSHANAGSRVVRIFPKTTTKTKRKVYTGASPSEASVKSPFSIDQIKNTIEKVSKSLSKTESQNNITSDASSANLVLSDFTSVSSIYETPVMPSSTVTLPSAEYEPISIKYRSEYSFEDKISFDSTPEAISVIGLSHFGSPDLLDYFSITYSFKVNSQWFNLSKKDKGISFVPGKADYIYIEDEPKEIIAKVNIKRIKTIPKKLLEIFSPEKASFELNNFVQLKGSNRFTLPNTIGKVLGCFEVSDFYYGSKYSFKEISPSSLKELDLNFLKSEIYPYEKLQLKLDSQELSLIPSNTSFSTPYEYKISNDKIIFSTLLASSYGESDKVRLEYKYPLENIDVSLFDSGVEVDLSDFKKVDSFFVDLKKTDSTSHNKNYDFLYVLGNIYKVTLPEYKTINSISLTGSASTLTQITGNTFYDLASDGEYFLEKGSRDIYFYFDKNPHGAKLKVDYSLKEYQNKINFTTKDSNTILINSFNIQQTSFLIPKNTLEYSLGTDVFFFIDDSDNPYTYRKNKLKSNDYLSSLKIYRDNYSSGTSEFIVPNFELGESKEIVWRDSASVPLGTSTTTSNSLLLGTDLNYVNLSVTPLNGLFSDQFTYKPNENKLIFGSVSATDFVIKGYKLDLDLSIKDHKKIDYQLDGKVLESTSSDILLIHHPYIDDLESLDQSYYTLSPKYFDLLVKE